MSIIARNWKKNIKYDFLFPVQHLLSNRQAQLLTGSFEFVILGHWILFVICDLRFVIYRFSQIGRFSLKGV